MSMRWTAAPLPALLSTVLFALTNLTTTVALGQTVTYPYPGTGANPPINPTVPTTLSISYSGCGSTSPAPQSTTVYVEAPFSIGAPLDAFDISWPALGTINESEALNFVNGVSQGPEWEKLAGARFRILLQRLNQANELTRADRVRIGNELLAQFQQLKEQFRMSGAVGAVLPNLAPELHNDEGEIRQSTERCYGEADKGSHPRRLAR